MVLNSEISLTALTMVKLRVCVRECDGYAGGDGGKMERWSLAVVVALYLPEGENYRQTDVQDGGIDFGCPFRPLSLSNA